MKQKLKLPPIGMRIIKSAVSVLLCFLLYILRGEVGIPFYSAIAALWCLQPYVGSTKSMAVQRSIGTLIGALYGLIVILFQLYVIPIHNTFMGYVVVSFMIIIVIYTTLVLNKKNTSYFSCVVFLSITVTHLTDSNPYIFVLNRIVDTMIGIGVGILVNVAHLPRKKHTDLLFISGLDDTLLTMNETMTSTSQIELNRMIEQGAKFTVATMRTPGSLIQPLSGIKLKLPVIVMDGAALYQIEEKEFLKVYVISRETTKELIEFIDLRKYHFFMNTIIDNVLLIYYGEFHNEVEADIVKQLRKSPYRNYIHRKYYNGEEVAYFMMVDKTERIARLYQELIETGFGEKLKILHYPSKDYKGFSYIKIYNKNATKQNMIHYLMQQQDTKEVITFGSIEGMYDVVISNSDSNQVVKEMSKKFEPLCWKNN